MSCFARGSTHLMTGQVSLNDPRYADTGRLLFGVGPFNPATLVAVVALLTAVSIAASTIPAVRAAWCASVSFR